MWQHWQCHKLRQHSKYHKAQTVRIFFLFKQNLKCDIKKNFLTKTRYTTKLMTKIKLEQNPNNDISNEKYPIWTNLNYDKFQVKTKFKLRQKWNCEQTQIFTKLKLGLLKLWQNPIWDKSQIGTKLLFWETQIEPQLQLC